MRHALGENHHITEAFNDLDWASIIGDEGIADRRAFEGSRERSYGMLEAAAAEVELLADEIPIADESGIDAELWEYVSPDVQAEAWDKAARSAVVFTEDRIRKWAGRPAGEISDRLAVTVFGSNGGYRLGIVDSEKEGWQQFAQGIAKALPNVDTHRIQNRPDLKRYALGVVGACSLLLTQMRYFHGNRFVDTSPATPDEVSES